MHRPILWGLAINSQLVLSMFNWPVFSNRWYKLVRTIRAILCGSPPGATDYSIVLMPCCVRDADPSSAARRRIPALWPPHRTGSNPSRYLRFSVLCGRNSHGKCTALTVTTRNLPKREGPSPPACGSPTLGGEPRTTLFDWGWLR
jgi:hypothetical protein